MVRVRFVACIVAHLVIAGAIAAQDRPKPSGILPRVKALPTIEVAYLGMTTTACSREAAEARGLEIAVCVHGQLVTGVKKGGPADKAGIVVGDIVQTLDDDKIDSQDDIADFLAVSKPEQKVTLHLVRADGKTRKLQVILGSKRVRAPKEPRLEWQFAGLGQLDEALAKAKKEKRLVLVGLSGAET